MKNKQAIHTLLDKILDKFTLTEEKYLSQSKYKDLSVREFHIILSVSNAAENSTMKNVASLLNITQGTLTTAIATLEKKQYLKRKTDPNDKRSVKIQLTKKGQNANTYHLRFHDGLIDYLYNKLTKEDVDGLTKTLSTIDGYLSKDSFDSKMKNKLSDLIILTDSTSDIDYLKAKELDVKVVSLSVIFGSEIYVDGVDIDKKGFYKMQTDSEHEPHTAQINSDTFLEIFNDCKKSGKELIYIGISEKLSGTMHSALLAKKQCDYDKIYIFDSQSVSCGEQRFIEIACKLKREGKNAQEIYDTLIADRDKSQMFFIVDSIDYLKKGGRFSQAKIDMSSNLNSKPVLSFSDGKITLLEIARGRRQAIKTLFERMMELGIDLDKPIVATYSSDKEIYNDFLDYAKDRGLIAEISYLEAGAVVGTHAGPNCLGIAFQSKG